jgi:hypothetical protein
MRKLFWPLALPIMGILIFSLGAACQNQKPSLSNQPAITTKPIPSASQGIPSSPAVKFDEKVVIKETQEAAKGVSDALSSGNKTELLEKLDKKTRQDIGNDLDLSGQGAKQLAAVITSARVVQALPDMVIYESAVGNETFSFYFIKEDGKWKFVGF